MRVEQLGDAHRVSGQHHDGAAVRPSALRARIDGAVMRLPGTGDEVARLVLVWIVKVDIAQPSNGLAPSPPVEAVTPPQPPEHCPLLFVGRASARCKLGIAWTDWRKS